MTHDTTQYQAQQHLPILEELVGEAQSNGLVLCVTTNDTRLCLIPARKFQWT